MHSKPHGFDQGSYKVFNPWIRKLFSAVNLTQKVHNIHKEVIDEEILTGTQTKNKPSKCKYLL